MILATMHRHTAPWLYLPDFFWYMRRHVQVLAGSLRQENREDGENPSRAQRCKGDCPRTCHWLKPGRRTDGANLSQKTGLNVFAAVLEKRKRLCFMRGYYETASADA